MDFINNKIVSMDADFLFFKNTHSAFSDNLTFESTMRYIALVHNHGNVETLKPISSYFTERDLGSTSSCVDAVSTSGYELIIATKRPNLSSYEKEGWISLDTSPYPIAPFLSKESETYVFINKNIEKAIVFVKKATKKWIDLLCSSIHKILPWRFAGGLNEDERHLFIAINNNDSESFNDIVNRACTNIDFKRIRYENQLVGWADVFRRTAIEDLKIGIQSQYERLRECQKAANRILDMISDDNAKLLSLQSQNNAEDTSVYEFFMNHKNIFIQTVCNGVSKGNFIQYGVLETIEYYDKDAFIRLYCNPNSSIGSSSEDVKELLYSIFVAEKGMFRAEAMFSLQNLSSISVLKNLRSNNFDSTYLAHPHLVQFGCLGSNANYIAEHFVNGDWDMAIEQSIAATKNINFGDAIVIGTFVNDVALLFNDNRRCIVADNDKEMTAKEFLSYIRGKQDTEEIKNG